MTGSPDQSEEVDYVHVGRYVIAVRPRAGLGVVMRPVVRCEYKGTRPAGPALARTVRQFDKGIHVTARRGKGSRGERA